jgi:hypothetical protein
MSSEPESFLVRWSRRKRAAVREANLAGGAAAPELPAPAPAPVASAAEIPTEAPVAPPVAGGNADAATAIPLPPIESLDGLRSDFQAFFQQPVAEELRHAALKKLFVDPHFNQMDMLDVYVDDYTQFEPLPDELRTRLSSARPFLPDAERAALEAAEVPPEPAGDALASRAPPGGSEADTAASADDSAEAGRLEAEVSGIESSSMLTAASDAQSADAPSADDPSRVAQAVSAPAPPHGTSAAPNPRST